MNLPDHASLNSFFNPLMGGYTIAQYVQEYYNGAYDKFHQQAADIDGKYRLLWNCDKAHRSRCCPTPSLRT